ncbi:MAG: hypothetical protein EOO77_27055 [Oxalobacteraceae bacterium]|nr:MAG: hypothetical protein EOO77_27055 [Oxalobacteraceae bacterium]
MLIRTVHSIGFALNGRSRAPPAAPIWSPAPMSPSTAQSVTAATRRVCSPSLNPNPSLSRDRASLEDVSSKHGHLRGRGGATVFVRRRSA